LKGDLAVADEIYSPNAVGHCRDLPDVTGYPEAEKEEVRQSNTGFPDTTVTIDFQLAEGDKVLTRWTMEGTNTGDLYGNPSTGRRVSVSGCHIHRISDGKIVEIWSHADNLTFMKQLGLIQSEE
jgi:predicted ester cyclase